MASTNQTAHYALPLYSGSDRATWTDTNTPFEDVDTALYGAVQDIGQAESQILNLQIEMGEVKVSVSEMSADIDLLKTDLAKENLIVLENKANIEALQADLVDLNEDTVGASVEDTMEATKGYAAGDWISVNNALYVATASISSGDALVVGTNVESASIKDITKNIDSPSTIKEKVDISSYNSAANPYVFPTDGYIVLGIPHTTNQAGMMLLDAEGTQIMGFAYASPNGAPVYVNKGMKAYVLVNTGNDNTYTFVSLE